jgi:hypothetical protein
MLSDPLCPFDYIVSAPEYFKLLVVVADLSSNFILRHCALGYCWYMLCIVVIGKKEVFDIKINKDSGSQ